MNPYEALHVYYGDIHNHCGISYGHGTLEEALKNARERLDFCSVTGHAAWSDLPIRTERSGHIIDFHLKGFNKLKATWEQNKSLFRRENSNGTFLTFLSYEIHSSSEGDHTILFKNLDEEIIYANTIDELKKKLQKIKSDGHEVILFPHHIGYKRGYRGIDWVKFSPELTPFVEIISMHGCSEHTESPFPFLHSMGPIDWESCMQYGIRAEKVFGVIGSTDHHSAHPGSYGHGLCAVWAESLNRDKIWSAFNSRRTYALTGDKIELQFSINDSPMGSIVPQCKRRLVYFKVKGGAVIDYVDVVKNNRLLRRFSQTDFREQEIPETMVHTKIHIEVGWGEWRNHVKWNVKVTLQEGYILNFEPRFRGFEVLSPQDDNSRLEERYCFSQAEQTGEDQFSFITETWGNPNAQTNATQGVCAEVNVPMDSYVVLTVNGQKNNIPVSRLLQGSIAGYLYDEPLAPAWKINRIPLPEEFNWENSFEDTSESTDGFDTYYVHVSQKNNHWAWSSPIFVETV